MERTALTKEVRSIDLIRLIDCIYDTYTVTADMEYRKAF